MISPTLTIDRQILINGPDAYFTTNNANGLPIYCHLEKNTIEGIPEFHILSCTDKNLKTRVTAVEGFDGKPNRVENNLDSEDLPDSEGFVRLSNETTLKTISESSSYRAESVLSNFFLKSGFISRDISESCG